MHLQVIHPTADHAQAIKDSKSTLTAPGYDRRGERVQGYKESLPQACALAKVGDLIELQKLNVDTIKRERDKYGMRIKILSFL